MRRILNHVIRIAEIFPPGPADQAIEMILGISPDEEPTQHEDGDSNQARCGNRQRPFTGSNAYPAQLGKGRVMHGIPQVPVRKLGQPEDKRE